MEGTRLNKRITARLPLLAAILLALVAAGLLPRYAAAGPAAPAAGWAEPQNVSSGATYSNSPALAALQASGHAVMAWEERDLPSTAEFSQLRSAHNDCQG